MSRRDLGSLFDEESQGATPAPSDAPRKSPVDDQLLNDEALQMLEERSRAARQATSRAAEVAAQKGKELGKAALGALGRMKEEHQRKAVERASRAKEMEKPEAYDQMMAAPMSVSLQVAASDDDRHEALLGGPSVEEAQAALVNELAASHPITSDLKTVHAFGMADVGMTNSEILAASKDWLAEDGGQDVSQPVEESAATPKRSYKCVAIIAGCFLALAAAGGAAYWWSAMPAKAPVSPTKIETAPIAKPEVPPVAPVLAPIPTVEPVVSPEPIVEPAAPPDPVEQPVVPAAIVEPEPARVVAPAPKPIPVVLAPEQRSAPIKPQQKKLEVAPLAQPSKQEEQQIDQIRDFGKRLEQLGER